MIILTLIAAVINLGARQCFSLDLINLHLLQYTSRGILAIFALLLVQCVVATYAVYAPHDLLKQGYFASHSTYTRIGGSLLQACWIFMGQLMFAWFYVYSLYSSYSDIKNAEYLFWSGPQLVADSSVPPMVRHHEPQGETWGRLSHRVSPC